MPPAKHSCSYEKEIGSMIQAVQTLTKRDEEKSGNIDSLHKRIDNLVQTVNESSQDIITAMGEVKNSVTLAMAEMDKKFSIDVVKLENKVKNKALLLSAVTTIITFVLSVLGLILAEKYSKIF